MGAQHRHAEPPSRMSREAFVERFGGVFEHSPWIAAAAWKAGLGPAQDTAAGLHAAMCAALRAAPRGRQLDLIRAHPDLAGRLAVRGGLTAESTAEQASAGLDRCTPEEYERFTALNEAYKTKFGFPFIMAVKGRSRSEILAAFERRISNDPDEEFRTALAQVERIALLRLRDLFGEGETGHTGGSSRSEAALRFGPPLMARLGALARYSAAPDALTRLFLTPEHRAAAEQVMAWMTEAGMDARMDAVGSVVGRYEGATPGAPALLLGSHIDTVRDAGKYDGALGVLAAIACVDELNRRGERPPFAIEVLAFGDEEGVRFPTTLSGSRAVAGTFDPAALEARDAEGVTMAEALRRFGCDPDAIPAVARRPGDALAYVELHIEQGPVLEAEGLPIGVVTSIAGISRSAVEVVGEAGHAGTVPMRLRRDALAAAAEMVLAVERRCATAATPDLVGTVGQLDVAPGAVNVIPGRVRFTLDVRAPDDATRRATVDDLGREVEAIAARRGCRVSLIPTYDEAPRACAPWLMDQLDAAVAREGVRPRRLPSGAGHDAAAIADLCPMGMLFLRCRGGVSHNPAEAITVEDADVAVCVLLNFVRDFAPPPSDAVSIASGRGNP